MIVRDYKGGGGRRQVDVALGGQRRDPCGDGNVILRCRAS